MNDRFKFKVWDKTNKIMHYNDFVVTSTGYIAPIIDDIDAEMTIDAADTEFEKDKILMQCTGLKDKNGKLIYEGDIVRTKQTNPLQARRGVIQWHSGYFAIDFFELGEYGEAGMSITKDTQDYMTIEIIGNIYENKELLDEIHN